MTWNNYLWKTFLYFRIIFRNKERGIKKKQAQGKTKKLKGHNHQKRVDVIEIEKYEKKVKQNNNQLLKKQPKKIENIGIITKTKKKLQNARNNINKWTK